jgi:tripartite-type tricarboxylate transporter receptor subunit TctC
MTTLKIAIVTMARTLAASVACSLAAAGVATAQDSYPSKPVRFIVGSAPGDNTDIFARLLADELKTRLGQPVIVENKPGAGGTLPAQTLQTSQPDGYTVAQIPLGVFRIGYTTKVNWDPIKDISYIINVTGYAFGMVVPADSPFKNWNDYVAYAKANPGKLSYGSTGNLTSPHLTTELIAQKAGVQLQHVPYKGNADLMQALLGGHLMSASDSTGWAPHVESGKLRVLNTWGDKRLAKFPDAPTLKELGYDIVQNSPFGIGAPRGTPPEVVKKLHDAFKQAMEEPSYVTALSRYDMLPIYMSSSQYTAFAQETVQREKALIDKLGLAKAN